MLPCGKPVATPVNQEDVTGEAVSPLGTGLGLSISRALVEKMGGTLDFESVAGRGTVFFFDLSAA